MRGDNSPLNKHTHRSSCFLELNRLLRCDPCKGRTKQDGNRVAPLKSAAKIHHFSHPRKSRGKNVVLFPIIQFSQY